METLSWTWFSAIQRCCFYVGYRLSQEIRKSHQSNPADTVPSNAPLPSQDISHIDGNTLGTTSASSPYFSSPFSHSKGKLKRFANQDYDMLKRRCKSRGQLFEDPEFAPSNRLLVDDNNQYIISYFGRTRFDGSSIQWLRPHVRIKQKSIHSK